MCVFYENSNTMQPFILFIQVHKTYLQNESIQVGAREIIQG